MLSALTRSCKQQTECDYLHVISLQGDMGEDGPKGDMGEKVCKFHFTFRSLSLYLGTCTEKPQRLAVAGKH